MKNIFILLFFINNLNAQNNTYGTFEKIINTVENEYIGYKYFLHKNNLNEYSKLKSKLLEDVTAGKRNLTSIVNDYIYFFQDAHMSFYSNNTKLQLEETYYKKIPKKYIGIWEYKSTGVFVSFLFEDGKIIGRVFFDFNKRAEKNKLLFQLIPTQTKNDFNLQFFNRRGTAIFPVVVKNNQIISHKEVLFSKRMLKDTSELKPTPTTNIKLIGEKKTTSTFYIKMEDFATNQKPNLELLLNEYEKDLLNAKNLIIDLTNNGGGNTSVTFPLIKYITNKNVRYVDNYIFVSDSMLASYKQYCENSTNNKDVNYLKDCAEYLPTIKSKRNEIILDTSVYVNSVGNDFQPKKIYIIINENTGSAAEIFAYTFKDYKNVVICGINSAGAFDTGAPYTYTFDQEYFLKIPSELHGMALTKRYDYKGIKPKVMIDFTNKDWLKELIQKIEK